MRRLAAMLFATIGCNEPEPHPVASCDGLPAQCQTSRALRVCEDDVWTVRSCEDECASEGGYPFGCLRIPDGDDVCNCEGDSEGGSDADPCAPGQEEPATCSFETGRQLWACMEGVVTATPCAELCAPAHDVGCFYDPILEQDACTCAMPGDPCDTLGYPTCVGAELLRCAEERWELVACPPCADRPPCVSDALGVGACSC